jgi:hypothetical protein
MVSKVPISGPGEKLKARLESEAGIEYLRFYIGSPGGETPFEMILHRPIGITDLDDDDWVKSTAADVSLLLARRTSPNKKEIASKILGFKKQSAVDNKLIQLDANGVVLYPSGADRNVFLEPHRKVAKGTVKDSNKAIADWKKADKSTRSPNPPEKVSENTALISALSSLKTIKEAKEEIAYAEFTSSKAINELARKKFPDEYRSLKGVFADTPQIAVPWAKGLTKEQLQHDTAMIVGMMFGSNPKVLPEELKHVVTGLKTKVDGMSVPGI